MRVTLKEALNLLQNGEVVALPTETVYGLAAAINQPQAIRNIYKLKGRPSTNPLIIHVDAIKTIEAYVQEFPPKFYDLAEVFWPGPLTIILPVNEEIVPEIVRAGLPTGGFRIPNHPLIRELLKLSGPLVMPSANLSGKPSATDADHVEHDFGIEFPVLDGGSAAKGLESTILFYQGEHWVIGRMGAIEPEAFAAVLGYRPEFAGASDKPICPGQHFRHYAPKAEILLKKEELDQAKVILGYRERRYPEGKRVIFLGSKDDPAGVGENLYRVLRQLDQEHIDEVWVDMDIPAKGLWGTIEERLRRAAKK